MKRETLNFRADADGVARKWIANVYLVGLPFAGLVFWLFNQSRFPLTWVEISCFVVFYVFTGLATGLGFHRCFSHQSYKPARWLKLAMLLFGSMACQGSVVRWVADHRRHHRLTDKEWDTHSPVFKETNRFTSRVKGLFHAHFGWLFDKTTTDHTLYARDILKDPDIRFFDRYYYQVTVMSYLIPAAYGWLLGGPAHAFSCLLIGGAARICIFQNVVWSVNSIGHSFGTRDATEDDDSRNNLALAILTFGEGWHNNHHASPKCAINQWKWYQIDMGGWLLLGLEKLGIVTKVTKKHL